jgi:hypothetical protein
MAILYSLSFALTPDDAGKCEGEFRTIELPRRRSHLEGQGPGRVFAMFAKIAVIVPISQQRIDEKASRGGGRDDAIALARQTVIDDQTELGWLINQRPQFAKRRRLDFDFHGDK